MSQNNRDSPARKARREMMTQYGNRRQSEELRVVLPEIHKRKKSISVPYPSEIFPTDYNQRLPEWRRRESHSARQWEHWKNWQEFQLAAIGTALGLSNMMQFPFNSMLGGRGSYVFAYIIIHFLVGFPLLFLQMALGQFTSKDAIRVFALVPLAQGTGISLAVFCLIHIVQTAVKTSWITFFVFSAFHMQFTPSFVWDVPWRNCTFSPAEIEHYIKCSKYDEAIFNTTPINYCPGKFYHDKVLNLKGQDCFHEDPHEIHWPLIGCLFLVYAITYALLYRGIKIVGRVMFYAVPLACIFLVVFLIVELVHSGHIEETIIGAKNGLVYFFEPDFDVLLNTQFWFELVNHMIKSLNLAEGTMIVIGSYAQFQSSTHYHAFYVCLADITLSLLTGLIIHIHWGISQIDIDSVVKSTLLRTGIATETHYFVTIIKAIDAMNAFPPIWVFMYFSTLFILGVMNMVAISLIFFKPFYAYFPKLKKWTSLLNMVFFLVTFLLSAPFTTTGSVSRLSLTKLLNMTPTKYIALVLVAVTTATFVFGYGIKRLCQDMDFMLQFYPNKFFVVMWVSIPIICLVLIAGEMANADRESYRGPLLVLWLTFFIVLLPIPIMAIWNVVCFHRRGDLAMVFYPNSNLIPQSETIGSMLTESTQTLRHSNTERLMRLLARSVLPTQPSDPEPSSTTSSSSSGGSWSDNPMSSNYSTVKRKKKKKTLALLSAVSSRPEPSITSSSVTSRADWSSMKPLSNRRRPVALMRDSPVTSSTAATSGIPRADRSRVTSSRRPVTPSNVARMKRQSMTSSSLVSIEDEGATSVTTSKPVSSSYVNSKQSEK